MQRRDDEIQKQLRTAVIEGNADRVDDLLKNGANPNGLCRYQYGDPRFPFMTAEILLHSVDLWGGTTFLAKAAENGNIRIIESLIKYGADIPKTLFLAYEKMYEHGYKKAEFELTYDCSETNWIYKYRDVLDAITKQNREFFSDDNEYRLSELGKRFFDRLIKEESFRDTFFNDHYTDGLDKDFFNLQLNNLLIEIKKVDEKKRILQQEVNDLKIPYERIVRTCMDYAMGCDFFNLSFLADLDVSGMNFVETSVRGARVTRESLAKVATSGADNAIIRIGDLMSLKDEHRKTALMTFLGAHLDNREVEAKKAMLESKGLPLSEKGMAVKLATLGVHRSKVQSSIPKDPDPQDNNSYKK